MMYSHALNNLPLADALCAIILVMLLLHAPSLGKYVPEERRSAPRGLIRV